MDLLSINSLSDGQIETILDRADYWFEENRAGRSTELLKGKLVFNLFYEVSTRTAMSFATASHRLGRFGRRLAGRAILDPQGRDVRGHRANAQRDAARRAGYPPPRERRPGGGGLIMDCPVINAGDGTNEHPTQALLDAATIRRRFGRTAGLKVAICGDIRHSRVARSNAMLLPRLGMEVRLAGPPELLPDDSPKLSVDEAIEGADVVMMLRVQRERLEEDLGDAPGEYLERYGLTPERLARAAPDAVVMHPGADEPGSRDRERGCGRSASAR